MKKREVTVRVGDLIEWFDGLVGSPNDVGIVVSLPNEENQQVFFYKTCRIESIFVPTLLLAKFDTFKRQQLLLPA